MAVTASHSAHADALERLSYAGGLRGRVWSGRTCVHVHLQRLTWREDRMALLFEVRVEHRHLLLRLLPHLRVPVRIPALFAARHLLRRLRAALLRDPETQLLVIPPIAVEAENARVSATRLERTENDVQLLGGNLLERVPWR